MVVVAAYFVCAVVWGTTWFAIRVCIGPGGYPTIAGAAFRFTIAALILVALVWYRSMGPDARNHRQHAYLILAGLLNGIGYALVYLGEETVSGAFAAILFGTMPLVTAFLAVITKTERVTAGHVLGALISLGGISIIFIERMAVSSSQALGVGLLAISVVVSSICSVILKREGKGVHVLYSTAIFIVFTALALWLTALVIGNYRLPWPPPLVPFLALLYLAIFGSVLTFVSYLYLLQHVSLMTVTTLVFIHPVVALFVDSQWEPEAYFSASTFLGAGISLGGVLLSVLWKHYRVQSPKVGDI